MFLVQRKVCSWQIKERRCDFKWSHHFVLLSSLFFFKLLIRTRACVSMPLSNLLEKEKKVNKLNSFSTIFTYSLHFVVYSIVFIYWFYGKLSNFGFFVFFFFFSLGFHFHFILFFRLRNIYWFLIWFFMLVKIMNRVQSTLLSTYIQFFFFWVNKRTDSYRNLNGKKHKFLYVLGLI